MRCSQCHQFEVLFRCSRCKITYYCNIDCQKLNWPLHKSTCFARETLSTIVLVNGVKTSLLKINKKEISKFSFCDVPKLLGIEIMYKRWAKNLSKPSREIALFLMIDPKTGLADPEWQMECGIVAFGLLNGDLSEQIFWDVYSYIFFLMDFYSNTEFNYDVFKKTKLNPLSFQIYQREEREAQANYRKSKKLDFNILQINEI